MPDSSITKGEIIERQKYFNKIVKQIIFYNSVDCAAVGMGGIKTEQYNRFLWLKSFATEKELIDLTNDENGNVKAYAYWALTDRNYSNSKVILEKHLNDTTSFSYSSGCLEQTKFINLFYLSCFSNKLNAYQIGEYKRKISKNFTEKGWDFVERMEQFSASSVGR